MSVAKRLVEKVLARAGPGHVGRLVLGGRTLVLAYHNVVPEAALAGADRSLHLTQDQFSRQVTLLRRTHDLVPLDEALKQAGRGRRPRVAITFDDAYAGAVEFGIEVLAASDVPAAMFVAPGRLGGQAFWWDALAGPHGPGPSRDFRGHVLGALAGRDDFAREAAPSFGLAPAPVPRWARTATEQELSAALARHPGLVLGSHSMSHPNLAVIESGVLRRELEESRAWLRARYGRVFDGIAYPYGLRSNAVEAAARAAGYQSGFLVEGGWLPRRVVNPFALPRLNVPSGVSCDGFVARVAGLIK